MTDRWPTVHLCNVLDLQRRWLTPDAEKLYTEIGIRSFGKGVFHKSPVTGLSLGSKRVLHIHPGDLVFNNVFAWEGAVAVAGEDEEGMIGSHRFVTFTPKDNACDVRYLQLYFHSEEGLQFTRKASPGSAGRNRTLGIQRFLDQHIPLPPLSEQRRIVEKIKYLAAKIDDAHGLREQAFRQSGVLLRAHLNRLSKDWSVVGCLADILTGKPRNGWSARCDNADDGTPVLTLSAVTGFDYDESAYKRTSLPTVPNAHYWLSPGDLLITRSNTPELVGHVAIYGGQPTPCIYPDLVMRVPVDETKADKRFVWYWLQSPMVRRYIQTNAKGTSPTMKKISQPTVMNIPYPKDVPLREQRRLVGLLDNLRADLGDLKALQAKTAAELDALLPSILDRAFKGEL